jgi:hypothetical protein
MLHLVNEIPAKDPITVEQHITWRAVPGECLSQLLSGPFCTRMSRDGEVGNAPAIVRQHQKNIQDLKPESGHSEKVY